MNNSIKPYLFNAFYLIKENINLLLIPVVIIVAPFLFYLSTNESLASLFALVSPLVLIVFYPLLYGKFVAIIYGDNTVSWGELFALHWWNFILVKIAINIPVILLSFINVLVNINPLLIFISIITEVFSIYIIPIVFIENQRLASIPLGIKCLLGNYKFSLPLIIISILPVLFVLLFSLSSPASEITATYLISVLPHYIFSIFIDFTVFITATLILKARLYGD